MLFRSEGATVGCIVMTSSKYIIMFVGFYLFSDLLLSFQYDILITPCHSSYKESHQRATRDIPIILSFGV